MTALTLGDAAEELYAAAPAEFMASRTRLVAQARAAKDRALATQIGKLRKPSVAAGILNGLVRARPDLTERLVTVGEQLRAAQATMHLATMSALRPDRDALIADWLAGAREIAGAADSALSPAATDEIRDTVIAALASIEATEAVLAGHLNRALSYSGFGEVDLADAVVRTEGGTVLRVIRGLRDREAERAAPGEEDRDEHGDDDRDERGDEYRDESGDDDRDESGDDDRDESGDDDRDESGDEPIDELRDQHGDEPGAEPPAAPRAAPRSDPGPALTPESLDPDAVERLVEEAGAAYAEAASAVAHAKSAVGRTSAQLDEAKARVARMGQELAQAEAELAAAFEADARAREAVTAAVAARQRAAQQLARVQEGD
jgi:hypothetical protein